MTKRLIINRLGERKPTNKRPLFRWFVRRRFLTVWRITVKAAALARVPNTKRSRERLFVPYRWRNENLFFLFSTPFRLAWSASLADFVIENGETPHASSSIHNPRENDLRFLRINKSILSWSPLFYLQFPRLFNKYHEFPSDHDFARFLIRSSIIFTTSGIFLPLFCHRLYS